MSEANEAKQRVLAVHPDARYMDLGVGAGVITTDNCIIGASVLHTGPEESDDAAWIDAASRLPASEAKEPAEVESGDTFPECHRNMCICSISKFLPSEIENVGSLPPSRKVTIVTNDAGHKEVKKLIEDLKASMQREKSALEDNERLRGLLRDVLEMRDHLSDTRSGEDLLVQIKAAVTGAKP